MLENKVPSLYHSFWVRRFVFCRFSYGRIQTKYKQNPRNCEAVHSFKHKAQFRLGWSRLKPLKMAIKNPTNIWCLPWNKWPNLAVALLESYLTQRFGITLCDFKESQLDRGGGSKYCRKVGTFWKKGCLVIGWNDCLLLALAGAKTWCFIVSSSSKRKNVTFWGNETRNQVFYQTKHLYLVRFSLLIPACYILGRSWKTNKPVMFVPVSDD